MALVVSNIQKASVGTQLKVTGRIAFDSSYVTGGEALSAAKLGLSRYDNIVLQPEQGYFFSTIYPTYQPSSVNLQVWEGGLSAFTPAGTNSTSAVTGTAAAQTWTPGAYTPSGTNSPSAVTGTGTADAQIFTGTPAVLSGTNSTSAVTGTGTADAQTWTVGTNPTLQTTVEEVVAVTAGTGVSAALANIPVANVESVYVTAGGVTGSFSLVPAAISGTTLCSINHTTGVLQFLIADAVTSATVTYTRAATTGTTGTNGSSSLSGLALTAASQTWTPGAYTPTGTNASSSLSGLALTAAAQTFTGDPATLSGTNGSSSVTGTAAAQTFTGTPVAASVAAQVPNGTNLTALSAVEFVAFGW